MKSLVILCTTITIWILSSSYGYAQKYPDWTQAEVDRLNSLKENIVQEEKEALKIKIENINARLQNQAISKSEAETLKEEAAENHALNIENRIAIVDNELALIHRNGIDSTKIRGTSIIIGLGDKDFNNSRLWGLQVKEGSVKKIRTYDRRTSIGSYISVGFLDLVGGDDSYGNSPFSVGRSFSSEVGLTLNTRVFKNTNFMRIKYGLAVQWNKLTPRGNMFLVDDGSINTLEEFPYDLRKSELRFTNLVVPVYLEFGPSKKIEGDDYVRFSTSKQFKFGIGGYGGFNVGSMQKLKYKADGKRIKQKTKKDFNTNDFVYGLGAYLGYGSLSLHAKYDLSPLFKNQATDQNLMSLGLKVDLD